MDDLVGLAAEEGPDAAVEDAKVFLPGRVDSKVGRADVRRLLEASTCRDGERVR